MGKIGIYGGSFNPIHLGHIRAAEQFARELRLDRVLLIPAATPPHKTLPEGSASAQQRLELVRLSITPGTPLEASDLEFRREGKSYTADTISQLRALHPDDELYLLLGTDMFLGLHTWYRPDLICSQAQIVCALREENPPMQALEEQRNLLQARFRAKVRFVHNKALPLSSTDVRRLLFFDLAEPCLAPEALAYIRKHHLYGVGEDCRGLPFAQLRERSLGLLKSTRVPHVIGCCETAVKLARRWGANETDAARAGILHDVTKALEPEQQLQLCEKYGIITDDFIRAHPKLLHAKTGAMVAKYCFGENDAVVSAINWHTTGRANMGLLEKIIYIADYSEPNRAFDGVEKIRQYLYTDLDRALYTGFSMSLEELRKEGKSTDPNSYEAWRFLKEERNFL